jgi:hypothetical protein
LWAWTGALLRAERAISASRNTYLADGKVYTHHEVRVLVAQGRGVNAWAPLDTEMEG